VTDAHAGNRAELAKLNGPTCPECVAGKHLNCDGTALDEAHDEITACRCVDCDLEAEERAE
jgi:hypothetical protein